MLYLNKSTRDDDILYKEKSSEGLRERANERRRKKQPNCVHTQTIWVISWKRRNGMTYRTTRSQESTEQLRTAF